MMFRLRERHPQVANHLPETLNPVVRRVYLNRGVGESKALDLSLSHLLPFHSLKGIVPAVDLLLRAFDEQWRILIVGDYDCDGATSTALILTALRRFGFQQVSYLVPDRFRYGYGLTPEIVALAVERKPQLLITVDNGISSVAGVDAAKQAGVPVLVTDHHLPGVELPEAAAIVNPNQPGCEFPSKSLAGVGVAFYLMIALRARLRARGSATDINLAELLDFVALGTVADLVPLDYNNRILVQQGLQRIRKGQVRPGIAALSRVAGRDPSKLSTQDLGFFLGPRLNAAGRLEDMSQGIACLLAESLDEAMPLAQQLHELNSQRKALQGDMEAEALSQIEKQVPQTSTDIPAAFVVVDEGWHEGVVGLVASRLKERYQRPVFAFAANVHDPNQLKGSGRSIPGFHLRDALALLDAQTPQLIARFGGHAMAAGLTLPRDHYESFKTRFIELAEHQLTDDQRLGEHYTDGELSADEQTLATATALTQAGPWGQAFPEPRFHGDFTVVEARRVGEVHLKLKLSNAAGTLAAMAFREPRDFAVNARLRILYSLSVNEYQGRQSVQLLIEKADVVG